MTEMERMQAEAVNNARAMYRRRVPLRIEEKEAPPEPKEEKPPESAPDSPESSPEKGLLGLLFEDKERTLLILLTILLSEENADPAVLLGLMYCLL